MVLCRDEEDWLGEDENEEGLAVVLCDLESRRSLAVVL